MRKVFFILGLVIALGSGLGLYIYMDYVKGLVPVVYAVTNIPEDTVISAEQLKVRSVPRESVPSGVAASINQVANKSLNWPLKEGDPVRLDKIEQNTKTGVENSRLIAFKTDYNGSIAGLAKYGQTVDLVLTLDPKQSGSLSLAGYIITDLFIEATADSSGKILSSADIPHLNRTASVVSLSGSEQTTGIPTEIIAKVTPKQFLVIKQAEIMGTISLGQRDKNAKDLYNINNVIENSQMNIGKDFIVSLLQLQK
ncbi:SAF domain-containing protein [Dehalobacter sp. TeCB1]|uniref:SAF domain-containing protein n=1 Tax=Dehalobacter sp. TeCB1 TaxID=1843715 RepID=UPI00083B33F9|nr:SAF domain-containing protein [Dehalobacter sp. TeCB1]OCZ54261.1 pilus assembly protein CpaB [Dehalobacter sp. TeCB1]